MSADNLRALKLLVVAEDDFMQIWKYFSEHFDSDAQFMKLGSPLPDEGVALHDLVTAAGALALQQEGVEVDSSGVSRIVRVDIDDEHILHGVAILQGYMIRFFYFDDISVGLVGVQLPDNHFNVARLSARTIRIR